MTRESAPRVLFVTQQYAPEPIGSGPYMTEMAEFVARRGASVDVLTCRPHYPDNTVPDRYRDGRHDSERINGVAVTRVRPWLPRRRGFVGRMLSELAFFLRGVFAIATGRVRRAPTVVSLCPSILSVLLGALAKRRNGRHVAVVHDIQSGLAEGLAMVRMRWILRGMKWLERGALNRADRVLVLSDEMGDRLRAQGVRAPIETLPIWVDTAFIRPLPLAAAESRPTVLYSGNLGRKQALDQIVAMAALLAERGSDVHVVLRGNGSEAQRLAAAVAERRLDNVELAPLVEREKLCEGLAEGDIHLVPQNGQAADFAAPSKVFGIMAAGRAFVAAAPPGSQLWRLRDRSDAFLCVPSGEVDALADAVERLAGDRALRERLGRNGRAFAVAQHDRDLLLERFASCLHIVPAGDAAPAAGAHILIFEPDPRGHAREWIEHLIACIAADPRPIRATILVPEELADSLHMLASNRVAFRTLAPGETRYCNHPRLAVSGFARWWAVRRHVAATGATQALFLGLDHLTLPLGLGLSVAGRPITGILFRPCTHYVALGCGRPTMRERVRDLRKDVLTRLTARNAAVRTIFSLDPYFPEFAAGRYRNGHKFVPIWDPAFPAPAPDIVERSVAADLPDDRKIFILFGEITERKGIFALLEAIAKLPADVAERAAILVAGRIDPPIRGAVFQAADSARKAAPALWLRFIDRRLASGEISALVEGSDIVLLPYQRFVGSSGVLLWAARFNRPVICQEYGLIGVLTRNFRLGTTIDTSRPEALVSAIGNVVSGNSELRCDEAGTRAFVAPRRPELFARTLLGADG